MFTPASNLSEANALLGETHAQLDKALHQLEQSRQYIDVLVAKLSGRDGVILQLQATIKDLQGQVQQNSKNSSKPPSSDGLKRPSRIIESQLKGKRKPPGGQQGHSGDTLRQVKNPDQTVVHQTECCGNCGKSISEQPVAHTIKRQVFDVVIRPVVTEHQGKVKKCSFCGYKTAPHFPSSVKNNVQYGLGIKTLGVYLNQQQFIPLERVSQFFQELVGYRVSAPTLLSWTRQCGQRLMGWYEKLKAYICSDQVAVKHLDETGIRVRGSTSWLHVMSNSLYSYFHYNRSRNVLLEGVRGVVVHDHWRPYFRLPDVTGHALCKAHHLRELQGVIERESSPFWARQLHRLLRLVCHCSKHPVRSCKAERIGILYDQLLATGLRHYESLPPLQTGKRGQPKRRKGHNLVLRLINHKESVLRSLTELEVPATNNQAERDLRRMKIYQKVSGGHRSLLGANTFSIIQSFLSTARKNSQQTLICLQQVIEENTVCQTSTIS